MPATVVVNPLGSTIDLVAGPEHAARDLARVAAVVVVLVAHRPDHVLHREPGVDQVAVGADVDVLEVMQQRRALVPRRVRRVLDDVVAVQRRDRDEREVVDVELGRELGELLRRSRRSAASSKSTRSILLTHSTRCLTCSSDAITAWRRDCSSTPLRASISTSARSAVDAPGDHVARVLHVARGVGDDELALRRREVAVRDVDRDALLALGSQPVGEQREVRVVEAPVAARALDRLELVLEDLLRLEQEPPDQRALAVVDRPAVANRSSSIVARSSPRACGLPCRPRRCGRRRGWRPAR